MAQILTCVQEECDVLSLVLAKYKVLFLQLLVVFGRFWSCKFHKFQGWSRSEVVMVAVRQGVINLPEFKAVMLASLRSVVPQDWAPWRS